MLFQEKSLGSGPSRGRLGTSHFCGHGCGGGHGAIESASESKLGQGSWFSTPQHTGSPPPHKLFTEPRPALLALRLRWGLLPVSSPSSYHRLLYLLFCPLTGLQLLYRPLRPCTLPGSCDSSNAHRNCVRCPWKTPVKHREMTQNKGAHECKLNLQNYIVALCLRK